MTDQLSLSLAYIHGFENSVTGPIYMPGVGPLAGTSVTNKVSADAVSAGVTLRY
jgi:long-chain fatty acid transport protein